MLANLPDGMTEDELMEVIDGVVARLAYKFRFGYHDVEDIMQDGRYEAIKALPKYDNKRPLENFLWTAVRNGLFNNKRNKFARPDLPCDNCPFNAYVKETKTCTKHEDLMDCVPYKNWDRRNTSKKNIMNTISIGGVSDQESERNMKTYDRVEEKMDLENFFSLIDEHIELSLKPDLIRMRNGISVPKPRREKVYKAIRAILAERGLDAPEAW